MAYHSQPSRLHRKIPAPYYIVTPDYKEGSSGIQCLHYLCHALNLEGAKAFIVGAQHTHPDLHTPLLTDEIRQLHIAHNLQPIAVYPEIVSGNPLSLPTCVRYMLNKEGVIAGNKINPNPNDLFFYYRSRFYDPSYPGDYLELPMHDTVLFNQNEEQERTIDLLYINRIPIELVDFERLPKNIKVLSLKNPLPLTELAAILKRARVMYSYESSGTCWLALFCGCPVVALSAPGYEKLAILPADAEALGDCVALNDDEKSLKKSKKNSKKLLKKYLEAESIFWQQLQIFIEKTQSSAKLKSQSNYTKYSEIITTIASAEECQARGDVQGAIHFYRHWLKNSSSENDWIIQFNLGVLLRDMGDISGAQKAFQAVLTQKPDFSQAKTALTLNSYSLMEE